ncbi:MAG: hypothetical protein JRJ25_03535 [Deltaproteobacteria bacterium]|nr:hypothetical protein [Deltaproteobacteria bacterium]
MSWYKNTSIWSALLAALAILLTQLPPISSWLPKPKLEIIHADKVGINNNIGIIGFNLPIELDNKGNVPLDVTKIYFEVIAPNGTQKTYIAESYAKPSTGGAPSINLPITSINLNENELWSEFVYFTANLDPTAEQELSNIRLSISKDIYNDIDNKRRVGDYSRGEAQSSNVETAKDFFDKKFDLNKGEYKTKLSVQTSQAELPFIIHSEFTVYEFHIETIKAQVDDYKYGAGIYFPPDNSKQAWIKLKPNKGN